MWWRSLALLLAGGVLGTGFGVALGFFLFPFVFPPPPAAEQLTRGGPAQPPSSPRARSSMPTRATPSTGARAA